MTTTHEPMPVGCAVFVFLFYMALIYGYIANVYYLTRLDFNEPYKAEIFRAVGVGSGLGCVMGYITFDEELDK